MGNLVREADLRPKVYIFPGNVAGPDYCSCKGVGLKIDVAIDLQATILKSNCSFNMTRIYIRVLML